MFSKVLVRTSLLCLAAWMIPAVNCPAEAVPAVSAKEDHAPTVMPDRLILTWAGDPATSQAVTWRTSPAVPEGTAQIAEAGPNREFAKSAKNIKAETTSLQSDLFTSHYHTAYFQDLKPGTVYAFRVGDGTNWTEWSQFKTATKEPAPFSFVYFGDAQNDVKEYWSRVIRQSLTDVPRASFLLHAGDLINHSNADNEWGDWHRAGGWMNGMIPNIATPGNHEYSLQAKPAPPSYRLSSFWRPQFAFPTNGPSGLEESVYYVDYQGTRFVSMNSNQDIPPQASWLDSVLADNPNRWTIVFHHHPIYSTASGRDNPVIRNLWQPVYDKYHVDLVLQGHDHTYSLTGMVSAENVPTGTSGQPGGSGTVYVVSVSGPKMYNLDRHPRMVRAASNTQLYQLITVDGDELHYQAKTPVGELYDAFTLKKRDGAANELIEQVPPTPERLDNVK